MLCILYVNAIGTLLGVAGLLLERALPPNFSRRWVWLFIIAMSVVIPGVYRSHHTMSVGPAPTAVNLDWWTHADAYGATISRLGLFVAWFLVIVALANALRVSRVVSQSRRQSDSRVPAVVDGVPVVVTDSMGPATVGLLRSRVLVPRWVLALPGVQRQYVLRHEEEHRRTHDARLLLVASLPLLLMPWNLAFWWLLRRLSLAVEMDCDRRVVSALGDATAYGELLLKVAQAASRGPRLQPAFLGAGMLEQRLTAMLAPTPLRHAQRFMLPALAFALLCAVLLMPHPMLRDNNAHATMTQSPKR